MDPMRKDEKFTNAEISKFGEFANSGEFEREEGMAPLPEQDAAERAAQSIKPSRPQLVTNETRTRETREETRGETTGDTKRDVIVPKTKQAAEAKNARLFPEDELQEMRSHWDEIQTAFVDQPRQAVEDADKLVAQAIQKLTDRFAAERSNVERQWSSGDSVSTEVLRQSLRRYRAFFERLLSA